MDPWMMVLLALVKAGACTVAPALDNPDVSIQVVSCPIISRHAPATSGTPRRSPATSSRTAKG